MRRARATQPGRERRYGRDGEWPDLDVETDTAMATKVHKLQKRLRALRELETAMRLDGFTLADYYVKRPKEKPTHGRHRDDSPARSVEGSAELDGRARSREGRQGQT